MRVSDLSKRYRCDWRRSEQFSPVVNPGLRLVLMGNVAQYLKPIGLQAHISVGIICLKCLDLPLKQQQDGNMRCVVLMHTNRCSPLTAYTHIFV